MSDLLINHKTEAMKFVIVNERERVNVCVCVCVCVERLCVSEREESVRER